MRLSRSNLLRLLQAILSFAIIYYLILLLDWDSVRNLVQSGIIYDLWPGPLIFLVGIGFAAERWRAVLGFLKIKIGHLEALHIYLAGTFYSVLLPGILGGDVIRVALCKASTHSSSVTVLASVTIERVLGLWGVSIIGTIGVLTITPMLRNEIGVYALLISPVIAIGFPLMLLAGLSSASFVSRQNFSLRHFATLAASVQQSVVQVRSLPPRLAMTTLMLSAAFQSCEILIFSYFGHLLQIDVSFNFYLFAIPIVYLSTVLPISLGGIGVREGVLVWFLAMTGTLASDAVLLAFLVYLNRIFVALIGGCWHLLRSIRAE